MDERGRLMTLLYGFCMIIAIPSLLLLRTFIPTKRKQRRARRGIDSFTWLTDGGTLFQRATSGRGCKIALLGSLAHVIAIVVPT